MTFYTEIFNGRDENADNPPSQWDSLKNVPYSPDLRDPDTQADFGIPSDAEARRSREAMEYSTLPDLRDPDTQADFGIPSDAEARRSREAMEYSTLPDLRDPDTQADFGIPSDAEARRSREAMEYSTLPDLRDPDTQADFGIPSDAEARRSREAMEYSTLPDLRDPDTQADFGIPSDAEARRDRKIRERREKEQKEREGLDEALSHRLDGIETSYVEDRTDLPGRKTAEQSEPMSKASARERILTSDRAEDLEACLDVLQNDPYAIEELLYQGFGIANEARATLYGEHSSKKLSEEKTKQLKNFISFFASVVERGIRVPSEFRNAVTLSEKGDSYPPVSELAVPLGVAIDEVATMVEEKGVGETSVDNPINVLSGARGKDKIGVRELADLAVKAYSTKTKRGPYGHKLSDDVINFPA